MNSKIVLTLLALALIAASISSCASQSTSTEDSINSPLQLALNDYIEKDMQLRHLRLVDLKISQISQQSNGKEVSAIFNVDTIHRLNYAKAEDAPALKGRLNFLRDYEKQLTAEQLKRANEDIEIWRHDLSEYINTDQQMFSRIKVVGELDSSGKLIPASARFYLEVDGPDGKGIIYAPYNLEEIPTSEEVEKDCFNAIRDMVGIVSD